MHAEALRWASQQIKALPASAEVLEIGSLNVNGTIREAFPPVARYVGIDVLAGRGVDVVLDASTALSEWPEVAHGPYDVVVCMEVLEHTPVADLICQNAYTILKRGGIFLVTTACIARAPHSVAGGKLRPGEFYRNVSHDALKDWLYHFAIVTVAEGRIEVVGPRDIYARATK